MPKLFVRFNTIQIVLAVCMFFSIQAVSGQVFYKGKPQDNILLKENGVKAGLPFHTDLILASNSIRPFNNFLEVLNAGSLPLFEVVNPKSLADFHLPTENAKAEEKVCEKSCRNFNVADTVKATESKVQKETAKAKQEINPNDLNLFISF